MGPHGSPRQGAQTVAKFAAVFAFYFLPLVDGAGAPGVIWNLV
jgi:hypothetical protein